MRINVFFLPILSAWVSSDKILRQFLLSTKIIFGPIDVKILVKLNRISFQDISIIFQNLNLSILAKSSFFNKHIIISCHSFSLYFLNIRLMMCLMLSDLYTILLIMINHTSYYIFFCNKQYHIVPRSNISSGKRPFFIVFCQLGSDSITVAFLPCRK